VPDPSLTPPGSTEIVWEGVLPGTSRTTGEVVGTAASGGSAGAIRDLGAAFCGAGVLPGDRVLFPGCLRDADCVADGAPAGSALCRRSQPGESGLCLPANAEGGDLVSRCRPLLASRRRYVVERASPHRLELGLSVDEIPRPSLAACQRDEDCGTAGFRCLTVRSREQPRCVAPCTPGAIVDQQDGCRAGMVCSAVPGSQLGALCTEAPPIDPGCWPSPATYAVQAGDSFLVSGTALPPLDVARIQEGLCAPEPDRDVRIANRIPLAAAHCQDVADDTPAATVLGNPRLLPHAASGFANPCLFLGTNGDEGETATRHVKAFFADPHLKVILTNLENFGGDADASRIVVTGGMIPLTASRSADVTIAAGARIVRGPAIYPYLYVVDQGRDASRVAGQAQILRLDPRAGSAGLPRFDDALTTHPFLIR
jgi:hypothetical protein